MANPLPQALVIGGSSGLGLEIAFNLVDSHRVTITGRHIIHSKELNFRYLSIDSDNDWLEDATNIIENIKPQIDILVYAAGYFENGTIGELDEEEIIQMNLVGFLAPALIMHRLLTYQMTLPNLIVITSTSQFIPRQTEPVYTGVKSGLGMLANSLSLDPHIGRVLVTAPGGMQTAFWRNTASPPAGALDPNDVAEKIIDALYEDDFSYKLILIPRDTGRVERLDIRR